MKARTIFTAAAGSAAAGAPTYVPDLPLAPSVVNAAAVRPCAALSPVLY